MYRLYREFADESSPKRFVCKICKKEFVTPEAFAYHYRECHRVKTEEEKKAEEDADRYIAQWKKMLLKP